MYNVLLQLANVVDTRKTVNDYRNTSTCLPAMVGKIWKTGWWFAHFTVNLLAHFIITRIFTGIIACATLCDVVSFLAHFITRIYSGFIACATLYDVVSIFGAFSYKNC
jgi:hypothetical protein